MKPQFVQRKTLPKGVLPLEEHECYRAFIVMPRNVLSTACCHWKSTNVTAPPGRAVLYIPRAPQSSISCPSLGRAPRLPVKAFFRMALTTRRVRRQ